MGSSPTWDCGYAAPTARMQYTASSFAQPLSELFAPVLRTRATRRDRAGLLPGRGPLATETPDVAASSCLPAGVRAALARLAERLHVLQQGRVQVYVLYIALTLVVLLVWELG